MWQYFDPILANLRCNKWPNIEEHLAVRATLSLYYCAAGFNVTALHNFNWRKFRKVDHKEGGVKEQNFDFVQKRNRRLHQVPKFCLALRVVLQ